MPDLDTQVREYIDTTSDPLTPTEILESTHYAKSQTPPTRSGIRGWLVGVAAMVGVLAVFGLQLFWDGDPAVGPSGTAQTTTPASTPSTLPNTTSPVETVETTPPTSTPSSSPDTTTPIEPSGVMDFTPIAQPNGAPLYKGVWFNDAFYALSEPGEIYKTSDGFTWARASLSADLPNSDVPESFEFNELETDGDRLVLVGETRDESVCPQDYLLRVVVLDRAGTTTVGEPELGPLSSCPVVNLPWVVVGSKGILIAGSIDNIAVGFYSPDGTDWTRMRRGPFAYEVEPLKADDSGFYAGTTGPDGDGPVYYSPDGTTWSPTSDFNIDDTISWRGQLVIEDDLIPADMVRRPDRLFFGPLGIIGTGGGGYGNDIPVDVPISFSVNGIDWQTWNPPEFETIDTWMQVIGIGDSFVVFQDRQAGQLWIGTPAE